MNEKITLELAVAEVNTVLVGLTKLPFENVVDLITNIRNQALPQANKVESNTPDTAEA